MYSLLSKTLSNKLQIYLQMFLERMFKLGICNNKGLHDEVAIAV